MTESQNDEPVESCGSLVERSGVFRCEWTATGNYWSRCGGS